MRSDFSLEPDTRYCERIAVLSGSARWNHSLSSIDLPLPVTLELGEALEVLADTAWILHGVPQLSPSPDVYLCTDSSLEGWGATLNGKDVSDV